MVKLMVDTQEKSRFIEIERYIKASKGRWTVDSYEVTKLKTGDYVDENWLVGFEYKGGDLLGSLYNGVLKQQLIELKCAVANPYLMLGFNSIQEICDTFHKDANTILGLLSSVLAKSHVPYILGGNYWVPHMVRVVHKHYEDLKGEKYVPLRPIAMVKQNATVKEWKLMRIGTLPNVGGVLEERIYEHFHHSYREAVNAPMEEWKKIPGISDGIAKKVQKVIS